MPYKNAEERRRKQKECMRKLRGLPASCSSVNPDQPQIIEEILLMEDINQKYDVKQTTEPSSCSSVNPDHQEKDHGDGPATVFLFHWKCFQKCP